MKNPLLNSFLNIESKRILYEIFLKSPTNENKMILEKSFKMYSLEVRLLAYFSKSIYFAAQKYDKKERQINKSNQLILDKPLNDDGETLLNLIGDEECILDENAEEISIDFSNLENYFEDEFIYKSVSQLNLKQKEILYLAYVKQYSDVEIGEILNVTRQAVNKQKNKAINLIRRSINGWVRGYSAVD